MRTFVVYTAARLALFAATYGLIWLIFSRWLEWSLISALYTAIIAMAISSIISLLVLGSLRDEFAVHVAQRAAKATAAFEARRRAEDVATQSGPGSAAAPGEAGHPDVAPDRADATDDVRPTRSGRLPSDGDDAPSQ